MQLVAVERLPSIEGAAEILINSVLRGTKAPLVKGSWHGAPEGLSRRSEKGSPPRGAVSRRLTERLHQICSDLSVSARAEPPPLGGKALDLRRTKGFPS